MSSLQMDNGSSKDEFHMAAIHPIYQLVDKIGISVQVWTKECPHLFQNNVSLEEWMNSFTKCKKRFPGLGSIPSRQSFSSLGKTNAASSTNPSKTYFAAYEIGALMPPTSIGAKKIQKAIRPIRLKGRCEREGTVERQLVKMPIYLFLEQLNLNRFLLGSL
ncbi:hypothetical protein H5410_007283 [Solanum commersonii]|uniref:Uncharacterized protein n=1 Tax=Solanum commersonii TaxID=4109 RepID=A0A9J6AC69_SOLCO|nr:hypothetical protein H5410_007283 [Solanum commersonii]